MPSNSNLASHICWKMATVAKPLSVNQQVIGLNNRTDGRLRLVTRHLHTPTVPLSSRPPSPREALQPSDVQAGRAVGLIARPPAAKFLGSDLPPLKRVTDRAAPNASAAAGSNCGDHPPVLAAPPPRPPQSSRPPAHRPRPHAASPFCLEQASLLLEAPLGALHPVLFAFQLARQEGKRWVELLNSSTCVRAPRCLNHTVALALYVYSAARRATPAGFPGMKSV